MTTYAATGHRPDKLGGFGAKSHARLVAVATEFLLMHQPQKCVSGMALGWDTAFAVAALDLGIPLIAALPFEGQQLLWPVQSQNTYNEILEQAADIVVVSSGGYTLKAMQIRNEWMVQQADVIAAMFDGSRGGTWNCLWYAHTMSKPIINLYDNWRTK